MTITPNDNDLRKFTPKKSIYIFLTICLLIGLALFFYKRSIPHTYSRQFFIIARDPTWYGIDLMGKERELTGFTNHLFTAISQKADIQFQWLESHPSRLFTNLDSGKCDAILIENNDNEISREAHLVSNFLLETGPLLVVNKHSTVHSLQELRNRPVGISIGGPSLSTALLNEQANANRILLINYTNTSRAIEALVQDELDGVILNRITAYTLMDGLYKNKIKVASPPFINEGLRLVALPSDDTRLLIELFNKALSELKDDGSYEKLLDKWNFGHLLQK